MSTRQLRGLTWVLVGAIAALAFVRSFEAIAAFAADHGWAGRSALIAPLLVDTFTVAAMLVILARAQDRVRAVYAWVLLCSASATSIAINIAHAPDDWPSRVLAALPPAALLGSVELVMSEARRARGVQPRPIRPIAQSPTSDDVIAQTVPSTPAVRTAHPARTWVRTALATNPELTAQAVMDATGVQQRRAYALLSEERGNNGQHKE